MEKAESPQSSTQSNTQSSKGPNTFSERRDEVKLQGHLLNLELRDQLKLLKKDEKIVERNLKPLVPVFALATKRVIRSLKPVRQSLIGSFKRIKSEITDLYSRKT